MKKPLLIVIIILIAAALLSGGILIGYFLPHPASADTTPVVTPAQTIVTPSVPTQNTTTPTNASTPTNAIVGTWKGEKSIIFVGSLVMNAVFTPDGKASVSGKLTSSTFGNYDESAEGTWEQLDATTYAITVYGYTMNVICDGKTISFSVNPYKLGLTDSEIADLDIELTLSKV